MTLTEIIDRQFAKVWVKLGGEEELSALWSSWWRQEPDITISPVLEENVAWLEDLATLPDGILGCPKGGVLLRDEYQLCRDFLKQRADKFLHSGVVVTGQPGIGRLSRPRLQRL